MIASKNLPDISAPIVPNTSLGGFTLRIHILEIQSLIQDLYVHHISQRRNEFELVTPFEALYTFASGAVKVSIDVRNGKVFKLTAGQGYKGHLFGAIRVGMLVKEAMLHRPDCYYSEGEELILCKDTPGVTLVIEEVDPPVDLVPELPIVAITVCAEEAFTPAGQSGNW